MSTTCCCPTEKVNWDKEGGICNFNFPCGSKDVLPFYGWYVDDSKENDVIYIPDKAVLMPSWIFALPCFWLHLCIMAPMLEANIFKIYENNGNLKLDYLCKNACSESIKYSRKKLILASLDEEKAGIFTSRKLRISLLCSNGMAPDKGAWLNMNSQLDESVVQRCVDLINSKITNLNNNNNGNDNNAITTFIEPSAPMFANVTITNDEHEKRRQVINNTNNNNHSHSNSSCMRKNDNYRSSEYDDNNDIEIPVATAIVMDHTMESRNNA